MSEQIILPTRPKSRHTMLTPVFHSVLQRCSNGIECEEYRKKHEGTLQRAAINTTPTHGVPPIVHDVLRSPGHSLDAGTRTFMESRFGHDFSGVRVHSDEHAAESARSVNALAYTVGRNVVFGTGQYAPGTMAGKRLLAHELTHVVQQGTRAIASLSTFSVSSHSDDSEREANGVADAILLHQQVSPPVIQRKISTSNTQFMQRQSTPDAQDVQPEPPSAVKKSSAQSLTIDAFVTNHPELTKEQKQHLDTFIATILSMLASHPDISIKIIGHTDAPGKEDYNMALGQKRANSVANYFISKKVPATNLQPTSKGETQLLIKTQHAEPHNRRVEIILEPETKEATSSTTQQPDATNKEGGQEKQAQKVVPPPASKTIPAQQAEQIGKKPLPSNVDVSGGSSQHQPGKQETQDDDKFHLGGDFSVGPTPVNLTLGHIPVGQKRNLLSFDFQAVLVLHNIHSSVHSGDKLDFDIAHDPSIGLGLSLHGRDPDGNRANVTAQVSIDVFDFVFKRNKQAFYELHITGAAAVDPTAKLGGGGNVKLQIQPGIGNEFHLNKHSSLSLNFNGTISYDTQTKDYTYNIGPVTINYTYHFKP